MLFYQPTPFVLLALLVGSVGACSADDVGRIVVGGERVEEELDPDVQICGGQLDLYDDFLRRAPTLVGLEVPDDFQARLHSWSPTSREDLPGQGFMPGGNGAVIEGEAYILEQRGDLHELAHLVFTDLLGRTLTSLREGIAEVAAPETSRQAHVGTPQTPLAQYLFERIPEFGATDYFDAGMFVRFVIDTYGAETFRELYQSMGQSQDEADGRARFEAVLGASIEDVDAEFRSQTRCTYQIPWCTDFLPEPSPLPLIVNDVLDCGASDTFGYIGPGPDPDGYSPYKVFPVVLEEGQKLSIVGSGVSYGIRRCGDCSEQIRGGMTTAEVGEVVDHTLPFYPWAGGRYYVVVEAVDPDVPVDLRIEALP